MSVEPEQPDTPGQGPVNEWVHQALERLYTNVELAQCELANRLDEVRGLPDVVRRAQALRNLLIDAIESLRPARPTPPYAPAARTYQVLSLRYISGLQVEQIAERIALGERQVYRDLRRAENELAQVLLSRMATGSAVAGPSGVDPVNPPGGPQEVDLGDVLRRALVTVSPLAAARRVELPALPALEAVRVPAYPGILSQILVQILSATVQSIEPGTRLGVTLNADAAHAGVQVMLPGLGPLAREGLLQEAVAMAASHGIDCTIRREPGREVAVQIQLPTIRLRTVLIVEDNPGVAELYKRYLQGTEWSPVVLADPRQAGALVNTLSPAVVILDVLMPEMEGWSVLQLLQLTPTSARVPVIVSSVIHDPELAAALGATACLKKPVSRMELLQALDQAVDPHNAA